MGTPYVGEIRMWGLNFAPRGWALCNGQILSIQQNTALFSLLGTNFGGNGTSNFGLPNLQGCMPLGQGQGPGLSSRVIGESGGSSTVTLLQTEIPSHNHSVVAAAAGNSAVPTGNVFGGSGRGKPPAYAAAGTGSVNMHLATVSLTGGNQPHDNMPPYLAVTFCIALQGIFPPRN
jgi:microcystin-dependent protein